MTRTSALVRLSVVVLTAMFSLGWWMYGNDFRGDTQAGRIGLTVERVRGASQDDVTEVWFDPALRAYQVALAPRLPVGAEVALSAWVAEFGFHRRGGSWVFRGELLVGRHSAAASVLAVESSNPGSLEAQIEPMLDSPTRHRIVLRAVRPGTSRISLSVLKLDSALKPTASEPVSDSLEITVQ